MSNSHVLFLHTSSDLYGADRSLLRTVNAIKKETTNVSVCLPYHGPLVDEMEKLGVEVVILNLAVLRRKYFTPWGIIGFGFALLTSFLRLVLICKKRSTRVIHSNTSAVLVGGFVAKFLGITHLWHLREIHVKPIFVRKLVSFCFKHFATVVIGVSASVIENLKLDNPNIWVKSKVINNGLDITKYQNPKKKLKRDIGLTSDDILVGMIGRVSHWKGQDLFLEVARKVLPNYPNVHFLALGSPFQGQEYLMDEFRNSVSHLEGKERFHIHEFSSDVSDYLDAFDIFVLPSTLPDPFPTTALEAMATKNAMVVNGQGGVLEMIENGDSGYIINPPNDVFEFTNHIEKLILEPGERKEFGLKAFNKVSSSFTEEVYAKNIRTLFLSYL